MESELKQFIYHRNNWGNSEAKSIKREADKNLKGDRCGKLLYKDKEIMRGPFPLLQKKRKDMLFEGKSMNDFKITY